MTHQSRALEIVTQYPRQTPDHKVEYYRYHRVRFTAMLTTLLQLSSTNTRVLEIGVNPGQFTEMLVNAGLRVSGTDLFPEHRADVWQRLGVEVQRWNITTKPPRILRGVLILSCSRKSSSTSQILRSKRLKRFLSYWYQVDISSSVHPTSFTSKAACVRCLMSCSCNHSTTTTSFGAGHYLDAMRVTTHTADSLAWHNSHGSVSNLALRYCAVNILRHTSQLASKKVD